MTCPATYLDTAREAWLHCALAAGHDDLHVEAGHDGAPVEEHPVRWWSVGDIEQVRGSHAPAPRGATWNPAALASITAGYLDDIAAAHSTPSEPVHRECRTSDATLVDQLVADAKAAGVLEERAAATQRVYAWAATLSKTDERLIAAKAAEVVQAGR